MTIQADQHHALYRFYDASGELLYVGITADLGARWKAHSKDKPWWAEVATCRVQHFGSRQEVLQAERDAIVRERPLHNVVHNSRPGLLDAVTRQFFGPVVTADSMPDLCHDVCEKRRPGEGPIHHPYRWERGLAHYICQQGHRWTCGWGHGASGSDPQAGVYLVPFTTIGSSAYPRARVCCPGCGRTHNHGVGMGWRDAHCGSGFSYYLVDRRDFMAIPDIDSRYVLSLIDRPGRLNQNLLPAYRQATLDAAAVCLPRLWSFEDAFGRAVIE